jgi:hypothetical protein
MTDPSISLDYRPPQIEQPAQVFSQYANLRNLMNQGQLQQQQLVGVGQENQMRQEQLDTMRATNQGYSDSLNADGTIDVGKLTQSLAKQGHGSAIPSIIKAQTEYQKTIADLSETNGKVAAQQADAAGMLGLATKKAGYTPAFYLMNLQGAINAKAVNPQLLQPHIQAIQQAMLADAHNGTTSANDLVKQYADASINASPKAMAAVAAENNSLGRKSQGDADLANSQRVQAETDFKTAISSLIANPPKDAAGYQAQVEALKPAVQQRLYQAVPAASYDPATSPGVLQRAGQTPAEIAASARLTANDNERNRHNRAMESQGQQRANQGQQRIDDKTANGGLTPGQASNVAFKNDAQYQAALKDEAGQDALNTALENAIKQGDYYVDNKGQPVPWSRAVPQLKNEDPDEYKDRLAGVKSGFLADMQTRRQAAIKAANAATVRKNAAIVQNGGTPTVSNEQAAAARGGQPANGPQQQAPPVEGTIVRSLTNPKQRLILRGGKWTPLP